MSFLEKGITSNFIRKGSTNNVSLLGKGVPSMFSRTESTNKVSSLGKGVPSKFSRKRITKRVHQKTKLVIALLIRWCYFVTGYVSLQ